jgi:phosphoenolpyruvate-protein kinase (PTS system EI component)
LFRIEVLFLSRKMLPTEEELTSQISKTIAPLTGKPITIRLLDIGGDKFLPYLPLPLEQNPFLGLRGVRLLLAYPELLSIQLRALLRLSQEHDIQILVPMVTVAEDMMKIREALISAARELGVKHLPPLGAMIETPAAALSIKAIEEFSDFLNIGTNDLTQYTMAAGRENALVYHYFKDDHETVIRLLRIICEEAGPGPVGLCGELAGNCGAIETLLRVGIRMLSVAPPLIPAVKQAVRAARAKTLG